MNERLRAAMTVATTVAAILMVSLGVVTTALRAQDAGTLHQLRGVAYDSLSGRPLAGALVTVEALGRSVIADSLGGFALEGVPAGRFVLVMQHERIDSLGLPDPRLEVEVPGTEGFIRITTPSFPTLWGSVCGGRVPNDTGFVHGTVRDARRGTASADVDIQLSWVRVGYERGAGVSQERVGGNVTTDDRGRYTICGVPNGVQLLLRARLGDARTDNIEVFHVAPGVTRRDFLLAAGGDSALRGIVRGVVRGAAGGPVANAAVQWSGLREVRSDDQGRFVLLNVPIGTRSLTVRSIGAEPMEAIADVPWGDTAHVDILLQNVRTLEQVDVIGSQVIRRFVTDLAERKELGIAKFVDSTRAERFNNVSTAIASGSNARMSQSGGITFGARGCRPVVWIDKMFVRSDDVSVELRLMNTMQIGTIEIYERGIAIPIEYWPPGGGMPDCAIVIWTKRNFP